MRLALWLSFFCAPAHGFAPSRSHLSARPRHAAPSVARSAGAAPPQSEDSSSNSVDSGKRVFVRNIAWKADVGAVRAHFERFGRVHQAWLAPNGEVRRQALQERGLETSGRKGELVERLEKAIRGAGGGRRREGAAGSSSA